MGRLRVEAVVRDFLAGRLTGAVVRVRVPDPRPPTLVLVKRSGGAAQDRLVDRAGVELVMWAPTEAEAEDLAHEAAAAMAWLDRHGFPMGIARVDEEVLRSDPDPRAEAPRWYGSYTLWTYEPTT